MGMGEMNGLLKDWSLSLLEKMPVGVEGWEVLFFIRVHQNIIINHIKVYYSTMGGGWENGKRGGKGGEKFFY